MKPRQLVTRLDDVQIVDVRESNEWDAGRIDGSRHVPADELADKLDSLDRTLPVVTVCRSGSRSGMVARYLQAEGFDAESLEGGLLAWTEAGLAVTTPDGGPGRVVESEQPDEEGPQADPEFQEAFMGLIFEIQDHFGDHEPTEKEVQGYLRERMIREGSTPEEADAVLARIATQRGDRPD
jgi:rhodanese-related sulfurtransferase